MEEDFTYWELKAIVGDLLKKLRHKLRTAHLESDEREIKINVYAINLVVAYFMPFTGREPLKVADIKIDTRLHASFINEGILAASLINTSIQYADDVRILGSRGHGVAAERANHMLDRLSGKDETLLGDDNAKNGADRIVGNEFVQTKYCQTGGKCISECFEGSEFRYINDGKPMTIEVPKDKYEDALKSMQDRINRGDMKDLGITDPEAAKDIIKKGNISYNTAVRIAKAGTVEGIIYDAGTGVIHATQAFGLSSAISFAQSIWRGEDLETAAIDAVETGTKIFGVSMMQHVATKQIGRTAVEKSLRPMSDYLTKQVLGSQTSAKIVNTFVRTSSRKAIHGAAATNQLSKLLRGNAITLTVTTVVMSSGHIYDAVNGRISNAQLIKTVGTTCAGVGGAVVGASVGSVVPVVGTILGGVIGSWIGAKASKKALDFVIEDDSVQILKKLETTFIGNIEELELDKEELDFIIDYIFDNKKLPKTIKLIHASKNKKTILLK